MSEFKVDVVTVGPIEKHPNADSLGITKVYDYPVIVKLGELKEGDTAVYIPVDAVVPDKEPFKFLDGRMRIKAKKLRGVFSMGLLMPVTAFPALCGGLPPGDDTAERLGITKYEPPDPANTGGECDRDTGIMPKYTDIQNVRRYSRVIPDDMEVVLTEKIHGANGRVCVTKELNPESGPEGLLWNKISVGSHNTIKKPDSNNLWWKMVDKYELKYKLADYNDYVFYFEVYGWVQDLRYGHSQHEQSIAFFDIFDRKEGKYLDWDKSVEIFTKLGLPYPPVLYRGPWLLAKEHMYTYKSTRLVQDISHIMEGVVIRPVVESWDHKVGRLILKYITEDYLLRKGGTERH